MSGTDRQRSKRSLAAEAGFRPCGIIARDSVWHGTSTTVSRALRLIFDSGLEDEGHRGWV